MKKFLALLLILVVLLSCSIGSFANSNLLELRVSINKGSNQNVTYTAILHVPCDAPKLVNFYMSPVNGYFKFMGSVWTDGMQIATYGFHQEPDTYQAKATCDLPEPYGLIESNIVTYQVPNG